MPVGFEGEFRIIHFVRFVILFSKSWGFILKLFSKEQSKTIGWPSTKSVISGYDTQNGEGIIISSPFSIVANKAL